MAIDPAIQAKIDKAQTYMAVAPPGASDRANDPDINRLISSGQYRDVPSKLVPAFVQGLITKEEALSALQGTPIYNPAKGPQIDSGQGYESLTPYEFAQPGSGFSAGGRNYSVPVLPSYSPNYTTPQLQPPVPQSTTPTPTTPGATTPGGTPGATPDISTYLNSIALGGTKSGVQTSNSASLIEELKKAFMPSSSPPAHPALVDQYNTIRKQQGVDTLEGQLNDVNTRLSAFENDILSQKYKIKGAPVSSRYIDRALVHLDADTADAFNKLDAERKDIISRLDNKNKTVETLMNLTEKDYQYASQEYQQQYDRNMQMYKILDDLMTRTNTQAGALRDDARSNIQIIQNAIKDHPTAYKSVSPDMEMYWNKLELQAGFPTGYIKSFAQAKPQAKILFHTQYKGTVTAVYEDPNNPGMPGLVRTYAGGGGGGSSATGADQKIITKFNNDLTNRTALNKAGNREQFIRQLQAEYPEIHAGDIARKVYETYPDNYEKK